MATLGINCSTENISLAILKGDGDITEQFWQGPTIKAESLVLFIDELLQEARLTLNDITAIGIAIGPGAFNGLRLSLVTAKTIALAKKIPLQPISTLQGLAYQYQNSASAKPIRVILDACRGEVSTALFDSNLNRLEADHPIKRDNITFNDDPLIIENLVPDAATIAKLASQAAPIFNQADILALVPQYSHESRISFSAKKELQHLKIGISNLPQ